MEETTKKTLKIVLDLYKNDKLDEEDTFILLDKLLDKEKTNTTYYPITYPYTDPKPDYPWERKIWYDLKPYCHEFYTTNTGTFTHKKEDDSTTDNTNNFQK